MKNPVIHALATKLKLGGCVYNDSRGVVIEVEGKSNKIEQFGVPAV
jgi:hydrogenase maturation factor HypF (carbamoyltransferase family)